MNANNMNATAAAKMTSPTQGGGRWNERQFEGDGLLSKQAVNAQDASSSL